MLSRIDQEGRQLGLEIESIGGKRQPPRTPRQDADTIIACLELHIEQANRLETNQTDIGIVTDIPGISRYAIKVIGRAGTVARPECQTGKMLLLLLQRS